MSVSDAARNADGVVNPGETAHLTVGLRNLWSGPISGVRAVISCADPNVTLIEAVSEFGDFDGFDVIRQGQPSFVAVIASTCPTPHELTTSRQFNDPRVHERHAFSLSRVASLRVGAVPSVSMWHTGRRRIASRHMSATSDLYLYWQN